MMSSTTTVAVRSSASSRRNRDARDVTDGKMRGEGFVGNSVDGFTHNGFVPTFKNPSYRAKLRYGAASINFTATTASVGRYVYSANGLFDPSVTGGALAPAGFAQLMLSYEHYVVLRAKATIIFTNNGTTQCMVGLALNADSTGSSDPSNMLEYPMENLVVLDPSTQHGATRTLTLGVDCSKFFGTDVKDASITRGDVISNPTEQVYFHALCYAVKGGTADVFMNVIIDYEALFTEPRELSASLTGNLLNLVKSEERRKKELNAQLTTRSAFLPDRPMELLMRS